MVICCQFLSLIGRMGRWEDVSLTSQKPWRVAETDASRQSLSLADNCWQAWRMPRPRAPGVSRAKAQDSRARPFRQLLFKLSPELHPSSVVGESVQDAAAWACQSTAQRTERWCAHLRGHGGGSGWPIA